MWTKNKLSSLSISVFLRMLLAGLISAIVFFSLTLISIMVESTYNEAEIEEIHTAISIAHEKITRENLSFSEANSEDLFHDFEGDYSIVFLPESAVYDDSGEEFDWISNIGINNILVPVEFSDMKGYAMAEAPVSEADSFIYYLRNSFKYFIAEEFTNIIVFSLVLMWMLSSLFSYIKTLHEGVQNISNGNLSYDIPVKGKNELSQLAVGINDMRQKLSDNIAKEKQIEQSQRMLITNMSHDLRTPLTSIIGYLDATKMALTKEDTAYAYVESAKASSLRLKRLIDDLFMYNKLQSNDVTFIPVKADVYLILNQILELKSSQFELDGTKLYIDVDMDKFHRIIDNLLENAQKYGTSSEKITIRLYENGDNVHIDVANKTDTDLTKIAHLLTNRLYTAQEDRKLNSTGLGLSIVKELTSLMGGNFEIKYTAPMFTAQLTFPKSEN